MMLPTRNAGNPDCRVPSTSPGPRISRSFSAILKPSLVSSIIVKRSPAWRTTICSEQYAITLFVATSDAAPQLMKLREPKSFRVLNYHNARVRHVHADFDHSSRNQDVNRSHSNLLHNRIFLFLVHSTMA